MTSLDISWHLLTSLDISCHLLTSLDISWHLLTSLDISWHLLTSLDISWHLLTSLDISWHLLTSFDISWHLLISLDISFLCIVFQKSEGAGSAGCGLRHGTRERRLAKQNRRKTRRLSRKPLQLTRLWRTRANAHLCLSNDERSTNDFGDLKMCRTHAHNISQHVRHFPTFRYMSQHVTTFHNISQHVTRFHSISQHFTTCHKMSQNVTTFHNISQYVTTCHNISQLQGCTNWMMLDVFEALSGVLFVKLQSTDGHFLTLHRRFDRWSHHIASNTKSANAAHYNRFVV